MIEKNQEFKKSDIINEGVLNEDNLDILCKQIVDNACYDKVGPEFYYIDKGMTYTGLNRNIDFVNNWLEHLGSLKNTSKNVGYLG